MSPIRRRLRLAVLLAAVLLGACGSVMRRATDQFADNLTAAILNDDDPGTVRDGVPAYLLLIDGMIQGDPENAGALLAGAKLYGAYAGGFVSDPVRAQRLADRAYDYAHRALCLREKELCEALDKPYDAYLAQLKEIDRGDVPVVYGFAAAWAGKIQVNSGDWNAIADLPKLQATLERCTTLDPHYDNGGAYLYLGVINSIRPASLGGKPEQGKAYFEKALELSGGKDQMVRVLYAQFYARLVFDKDLHDKLLNAVLAADPHAPGLTLINTLAKEKAKVLLDSGKDYF
ncbi:MAG: TRAP transporter TatT component family protein [Proteobacteria bacterium]|nr:TRAP transporter TatT component family protein [Pseudomonadota bacterium]